MVSIAKNYLSLDQWSVAEEMAREAMLIREQLAASGVSLVDAQSLYGEILLQRGRLDEAEKILVSAYEGLAKLPEPIPPSPTSPVTTTLDRLIQLSSQTNKAEEADKHRRQKESYLSGPQPPQK